jgi:hypothetical protein
MPSFLYLNSLNWSEGTLNSYAEGTLIRVQCQLSGYSISGGHQLRVDFVNIPAENQILV